MAGPVTTTAVTSDAPTLNYQVITERAGHLGLTDKTFAHRTGVRLDDIGCGLDPRAISLLVLTRLARVLDLGLDELVTTRPDPQPDTDDAARSATAACEQARAPHGRWADHAVVYATLTWGDQFSLHELCTVLGWSRSRLADALTALDARLTDLPVRLAATDDILAITLRPGVLPTDLQRRLDTTRLLRQPLPPNQARELLQLVREEILRPVPPAEQPTDDDPDRFADRVRAHHAAWLVHRGLATAVPADSATLPPGPVTVHPDVMFALRLTAEPAAVSSTAPHQDHQAMA